MAPINARVVRRSLALRGLQQRISYSECSSVRLWLRMLWVYASSLILALALALALTLTLTPDATRSTP